MYKLHCCVQMKCFYIIYILYTYTYYVFIYSIKLHLKELCNVMCIYSTCNIYQSNMSMIKLMSRSNALGMLWPSVSP